MYRIYPNVVSNIKKTLKKLKLELLTDPPEGFIEKKLRFYWAYCRTETGEKVFFKSLLRTERGIKNRFLNEINFLEAVNKKPSHPLKSYVAKVLYCSKNPSFIYLCYKFLPGKTKRRGNKFSKQEIRKIAETVKIISSSPLNQFNLVPKKPFFSWAGYNKRINLLLKKLALQKSLSCKIQRAVAKNKDVFSEVKPALTHGDYSEANVLFYRNKVKLLDWEHIHLRNPLFDLASFWVKRKREKTEQKELLNTYLKELSDETVKKNFGSLFLLAVIELCLGDLIFVTQMREMLSIEEKEAKKEKVVIKKARQSLDKQEAETLQMLKKVVS